MPNKKQNGFGKQEREEKGKGQERYQQEQGKGKNNGKYGKEEREENMGRMNPKPAGYKKNEEDMDYDVESEDDEA